MTDEETILQEIIKFMNSYRSDGTLKESDLQFHFKSSLPRAAVRGLISNLEKKDYLQRKTDSFPRNSGIQPISYWVLSEKGIEFSKTASKKTHIPAADRFVSRSDNEEAANSASQVLSDLSEKIRISNEFSASQEERVALSKEVAGIGDLISQSTIRASAIWNAIHGSGVLRWLAERAADASINALAFEAIKHLSKLCGFG